MRAPKWGRIIDVVSRRMEIGHIVSGAVFLAGDQGDDISGRVFAVRGMLFSYDALA